MSVMRVHIDFDDYPEPSLKEEERARQGTTEDDRRSYAITGPAQRRRSLQRIYSPELSRGNYPYSWPGNGMMLYTAASLDTM